MQRERMKVFIRNTQTGWYYQDPSKWTPEQEAACDLRQVAKAVERIFEAHLENVEILLSYDEPRYDLILPVPSSPSWGDAQGRRQTNEESCADDEVRPAIPRKKEPPL